MLMWQTEQEVVSTLENVVRSHVLYRLVIKFSDVSGTHFSSKHVEMQLSVEFQDTNFKIKAKWLDLALPTTKKEGSTTSCKLLQVLEVSPSPSNATLSPNAG